MAKVAINGFGRIGRLTFRTLFGQKDIEIVAINDLTKPTALAHMLKYDSAQGRYKVDSISADDAKSTLTVDGKTIRVCAERDPKALPWKQLSVDLVVECTGFYVDKEGASQHLTAGAKKVVISAPAKDAVPTIVYNVNHKTIKASDKVISGASCTTNCLAPVAKVLQDSFKITKGLMTTVHSFTNDQRVVDSAHADLRRARAASYNIIPNSTGAAKAIGLVIPEINGKLSGMAFRVPVITGSVVDLIVELEKTPSIEEINKAMLDASKGSLKDTLGYTNDEIVSTDIIGSTYGSIFDATQTMMVKGDNGRNLYKIVSWYDNEMSYTNQLCRTVKYFLTV